MDVKSQQVFTTSKLAGLSLPNRILKAGCFEGMSQNGGVTTQLIEHHRRIAQGGTAMTTVAYCSVSFDGRAFEHEMWMRREIIPDLQKLTQAVHHEGAYASIQLGHCGYFANKKVIKSRPVGASAKFNLFQLSYCKAMSEDEIRKKINDFARAAVMAQEAGFDAVEIHAGHGYLLSQFLSPYTNRRKDKYGGSLENRLRFPAEVIRHIRELLGPGFPILVKMNQRDGMKGGLEIEEAVEIAREFEQAGASAVIPSCGFTSKTPLYMLRGNVPLMEMVKNQKGWLSKMSLFLFGKFLVQEYPHKKLFLMQDALKIKEAVTIPVIYIGGILDGRDVNEVLDRGFDFIQVGRALIHDPDFTLKLKSKINHEAVCDSCNRCIASMDAGGVFCVSKKVGYLNS